ncbi:MAG: hypothetical protein GC153_02900 [Alphaproteobacteria bacterium]|nr:hypothetical protein [Alphaproteobacteria bacterium]
MRNVQIAGAAALAAFFVCAQSQAAGAPAGFPDMKASYRAVYDLHSDEKNAPKEITLEADGPGKMRIEMAHMNAKRAKAGSKLISVFDASNDQMIMYATGPEAPKKALVMPQKRGFMNTVLKWKEAKGPQPKRIGTDKVAGLSCEVWQTDDAGGRQQACITSDGILLRAGKAGEEPEIVAREVRKGPMPDSDFKVPDGFEVLDMGPCQDMMQKAAEAARAGKQPDMTAMMKCQSIGQEASEIFGEQ